MGSQHSARLVVRTEGPGWGNTQHKGQKKGRSGEEESLVWDKFPYVGLMKTYNTDRQVPDSATTATALFTGVKTRFGMVGLDEQSQRSVCDNQAVERASELTGGQGVE